MNNTIKVIYSIFIGVLFATFIGVGIQAFYPEPKYPEYPVELQYQGAKVPTESDNAMEKQKEYDKQIKDFQNVQNVYSRNVSIIALVSAIIALVISLTFMKSIMLIADGLMVGGLLTLIYSIIRGFSTQDNMFRFIVVTAGFIVSLVVGYIKFIRPATK